MTTVDLKASIGEEAVDTLLKGLIGIYRLWYSHRIRSVYIIGSYAEQSAVAGSDLDVYIVFDPPLEAEEQSQFRQVTQQLALISPVRLDCGSISTSTFPHGVPAAFRAALLVYGEDVLASLPPEPIEHARRRAMSNSFHMLYLLRQRADNLLFPLMYPDPTGTFYGYEQWGTHYGGSAFGPGVRTLVSATTFMATTLVTTVAEQQIGSKHQSVQAYTMYVGDQWAPFVSAVYETCKQHWQYRLPESTHDIALFQSLCTQMLAFENHFLTQSRPLVLDDLLHPDITIKQSALYRLKRIAYPGDDFVTALQSVACESPSDLADEACNVLHRLNSRT